MTHQFVGDPPHFWHFVRAKIQCDLSEVVMHIVVAVQLNDHDELPKYTDTDKCHKSEITLESYKCYIVNEACYKVARTLLAHSGISNFGCCPSPWTPAADTDTPDAYRHEEATKEDIERSVRASVVEAIVN